jgi:hypothetical protein
VRSADSPGWLFRSGPSIARARELTERDCRHTCVMTRSARAGFVALFFCVTACSNGGGGHALATTTTSPSSHVEVTPSTLRHVRNAQANAEALCRAAFGTRFLNAAAGTVAEVRTTVFGPGARFGKDAFPGASPRAITAWCWVGNPGLYRSYAVGPGSARVYMGGIGGSLATTTPQPGPPVIP